MADRGGAPSRWLALGRLTAIMGLAGIATSCCGLKPTNREGCAPRTLSAFIVAHPDDWQLFMGDVAAKKAADHHSVVFIYVTAGGADRPSRYWQAREAGSLASAYALANLGSDERGEERAANCEDVAIADHRVRRCAHLDVASYFLRLPDGASDGSGFEATAHQSLERFAVSPASGLVAVDGSTAYQDWDDLTRTIDGILAAEKRQSGAQMLELHSHDPDAHSNPGDHSDHRAVGRLASVLAARRAVPVSYYAGYGISQRPPNLTVTQTSAKMLVFMAYDRQRVIADRGWSAYAEEPAAYSSWLFRTYGRAQRGNQQ